MSLDTHAADSVISRRCTKPNMHALMTARTGLQLGKARVVPHVDLRLRLTGPLAC